MDDEKEILKKMPNNQTKVVNGVKYMSRRAKMDMYKHFGYADIKYAFGPMTYITVAIYDNRGIIIDRDEYLEHPSTKHLYATTRVFGGLQVVVL